MSIQCSTTNKRLSNNNLRLSFYLVSCLGNHYFLKGGVREGCYDVCKPKITLDAAEWETFNA